jgi:hypothetical protein
MIEPWVHEIARQRHQDLLARAERYRLDRIVRDRNAHRRTLSLRPTRLAFGVSRSRQAFRLLITIEGQASAKELPDPRGRRAGAGDAPLF